MKPRALAAELFGTFTLALAVLISLQNPGFPIPTPVIAGLTLGLLVYTIGPISGCHINPAVTVGLFSIGKIDLMSAGGYIGAQFIGAFGALGVGLVLFPDVSGGTVGNTAAIGLAEMLGAMIFLFGIAAVVLGRVPEVMSGIVIGGSLALGVSFAAHTSAGVLNPAVALGVASFSLAYIWGPIVGAVVGAMLSRALGEKAADSGG